MSAYRLRLPALIVALAVCAAAVPSPAAAPRNVILMVADGCAAEQYTLARWFTGKPLALDAIRSGVVRTYIADSVVADSAPAASAFATGVRTSDKFISVGPRAETLSVVPAPPAELQYRPLATLLEAARLAGKAVGVVATSRFSHATPAAFLSHSYSRSLEEDLSEQAVYQQADVVFAGGRDLLLPKKGGGKRKDSEDLVAVLRARGYAVVQTREQLNKLGGGKAFGAFSMGPMAAEIDRPQTSPDEPTLEEMTSKAIELLSKDSDGFFLMVEGSQIDWANHANDPGHMLSDVVQFDRAVAAALKFAKQQGNTLVIALSDHNTGGMSIGNLRAGRSYSQMSVEGLVEPLKRITASTPRMWRELTGKVDAESGDAAMSKPKPVTVDTVKELVKRYWGLELAEADAKEIVDNQKAGHNILGEVLSARYTYLGWTTHGHTGGDVPLHSFGPDRPIGTFDGPAIGQMVAGSLGTDLAKTTERLFVDAQRTLSDLKVSVDKSDPTNPVVRIVGEGLKAEAPMNKNLLSINGRSIELEGVTVYIAKTDKAWLPQQAIRAIEAASKK